MAPASAAAAPEQRTEVVVTLDAPPLATAIASSRVLSARTKAQHLDLRTPTSVAYLRGLAAAQRTLQARIASALPAAQVRWHYRIVLNGLAVSLPAADVARLSSLPGIARVYSSVRYRALADYDWNVPLIGATSLSGWPTLAGGNGIKIGIVDDGVDQSHSYFNSGGFSMPAGFPKGQAAYTTDKVIVARAFAPASPKWKNATHPFDPLFSEHATHVAGIAAGDYGTNAINGVTVSGIAPQAQLGNYKVLTIPTVSDVGLDGNSPEIAAGIEAAVSDGMDVINLSLGEPEIEPGRDLVVKAINAAADAGVVPAIAAGNDFSPFGYGSIGSPGSAAKAITSAAVSRQKVVAGFSSAGPTPVSLQMKPDVSAPGVAVLSSIPDRDGTWASWDGTSMASPHVAGAAALLRQLHPSWTVAELKSALVQTGAPVYTSSAHTAEALPTREGGGLIYLPAADNPLLFAQPSGLSFGEVRRGQVVVRNVALTNADNGSGNWNVSVHRMEGSGTGATLSTSSAVSVPGTLAVTARAPANAREGTISGFVVLTKDSDERRIPFWLRVIKPALGRHKHGTLPKTGTYKGNTAGKQALVTHYRYPDVRTSGFLPAVLRGPEQVFRVRLPKKVANFGVAVLSQASGVRIEPRVVQAGNENRLTGYPALPINLNPYVISFFQPVRAAGAVLPNRGSYDVVFDSTNRAAAGRFTFRFWIGDTTPPALRLLTPSVTRGKQLRLSASDAGSGIDSTSIHATVDGHSTRATYSSRPETIAVSLAGFAAGTHKLRAQVSDYQETRNMEDVGRILPNTRVLTKTIRVK